MVLCAHDPLTGEDHRGNVVSAAADAVLIVDSVFAFRPEYNDLWDYRIWLHVDAEVSSIGVLPAMSRWKASRGLCGCIGAGTTPPS